MFIRKPSVIIESKKVGFQTFLRNIFKSSIVSPIYYLPKKLFSQFL